jgi:hypothetical protein
VAEGRGRYPDVIVEIGCLAVQKKKLMGNITKEELYQD